MMMHNDEKRQKAEFLQKFFFNSFWISVIILFVASALCIIMHDFQIAVINKYFPMDIKEYNYLVVMVFGIWKALIIQFTLVPALAILCIRKCCKCGCNK